MRDGRKTVHVDVAIALWEKMRAHADRKAMTMTEVTTGRRYRVLRTVVIDDTGWLQVLNDKGLAETVELERFSDLRGVPK